MGCQVSKFYQTFICISNILINYFIFRGKIVTLYDKPPAHFRRLTIDEIHEVILLLIERKLNKYIKKKCLFSFILF